MRLGDTIVVDIKAVRTDRFPAGCKGPSKSDFNLVNCIARSSANRRIERLCYRWFIDQQCSEFVRIRVMTILVLTML